VVEVIASCVDITELRRTEELLKKSEKLSVLGELAAGIAHEIRNPLTTLKGFVQLQKEHVKLDPLYVDVMLSELDRINEIVSEFLILSKPQASSFKKLDLVKILFDTMQFMEPQATLNNIQFHNKSSKMIPEVNCEENQLKQVFINVIRNAIEAMPEGGVITVETQLINHKEVCIRFIDQGCGIPNDKIKKLGEPFYTTKEKGNGLGLMVSYKIIEGHKGRIIFKSEENKGTRVEIVLPIDLPEPILMENQNAS
jgi:signal transduction histidine kinase